MPVWEKSIDDIKRRTVRGGMVTMIAQAAKFFLRMGSVVVMARLLLPEDFGLVGMVTAVTGVLGLVRDAGLGTVSVQRESITSDQVSTLFWLNMAIGIFLGGICVALAPILVSFFGDHRLFWVTMALSTAFIFNAASTQHHALLRRELRYGTIAVVEICALLISISMGIGMALGGFSYWSLVGSAIMWPAGLLVGVWVATGWTPGMPRRNVGARSMLHFGGTVTLNSIVTYLAYNLDKVLLGRVWGAEALGFYGRAYQLVNLPTEQLNSSIGTVAFPALSRIQNEPERLKNYFLKGYSMVIGMTIPVTIMCALLADDLILVLLGPKWTESIPIFRLFSPSILAFALINPFSWLLVSTGKVFRSLKIALTIAPLLITAYLAGIPYGPRGIASGFSIMMVLLILPVIAWAKHGSGISSEEMLETVKPPLISGIIAGIMGFVAQTYFAQSLLPYQRLIFSGSILLTSYLVLLLSFSRQKQIFVGVLMELKERTSK